MQNHEKDPSLCLVSVVMAAYNTGRFITAAIQSVIEQTHEKWELIVVDDGSTDDTGQLVRSIPDSRISYYYQDNAGPAAARQKGVSKASADYIVFFDSDDVLRADALQRHVAVLANAPEVCVSYGDEIFMSESGVVIGSEKRPNYSPRPDGFILEELLKGNFIFGGASCIRRSCLAEIGDYYHGLLHEDWNMWCRLATVGQFRYVGEGPVMQYRLRENSLVRTHGKELEVTLNAIDSVYRDELITGSVSAKRLRLLRRKREVAAYAFSAKHEIAAGNYVSGIRQGVIAIIKDLQNPFDLALPRLVLRSMERRCSG